MTRYRTRLPVLFLLAAMVLSARLAEGNQAEWEAPTELVRRADLIVRGRFVAKRVLYFQAEAGRARCAFLYTMEVAEVVKGTAASSITIASVDDVTFGKHGGALVLGFRLSRYQANRAANAHRFDFDKDAEARNDCILNSGEFVTTMWPISINPVVEFNPGDIWVEADSSSWLPDSIEGVAEKERGEGRSKKKLLRWEDLRRTILGWLASETK